MAMERRAVCIDSWLRGPHDRRRVLGLVAWGSSMQSNVLVFFFYESCLAVMSKNFP